MHTLQNKIPRESRYRDHSRHFASSHGTSVPICSENLLEARVLNALQDRIIYGREDRRPALSTLPRPPLFRAPHRHAERVSFEIKALDWEDRGKE